MSSYDENIIIKSISRSLKTEIKFLTLALTIGRSSTDPSNLEEKPIVVLMAKESIFILLEDFKTVKLQFGYNSINKIYLDIENANSLMICLNKEKTNQFKISVLQIFVKDRANFIKSLLCYHSIYNMENFGIVNDLLIRRKKFFIECKEESLLLKGLEMIHSNPEGFIKVSKKGAE
jgi:hypothetical protein